MHEPPRVVVDNHASRDATVVEVHAPDSIGVLYRITRALAELDLDIVSAKVQTLGDRVVDAFYVRDRRARRSPTPPSSSRSSGPSSTSSRSRSRLLMSSTAWPTGSRPTRQDLLRWSEALAGIARTGLGFTESLYEQERFEEVLAVAADIRASIAADAELDVEHYVDEWMRSVGEGVAGYVTPEVGRRRGRATTTSGGSCSCSGPTPASGSTRPAGPTSATRRPRWR